MTTIDILQIALSGSLFSLIWLVQLLIYPSFRLYDSVNFKECMLHHQNRITYVVIPLMMMEVIVTVIQKDLVLIGIVSAIWVSTAFVQVPLHKRLVASKSDIDYLIQSNWIRTILWTAKLFIVLRTAIHAL